jgi:hypothetical protein
MMKGFIFTVDAIFSLIVASAAISILLYMQFASPQSYQAPVTAAQGLLQSMLHVTMGQVTLSSAASFVVATPYTLEMPFGYANFNGASSYIKVPAISGLTSTHTTTVWINPASVGASLNIYVIDMGGNNNWIQLIDAQSNGALEVRAGNSASGYVNGIYQFKNPNEWYFIAITQNATNALTIYVNGVLDNSGTVTSQAPGAVTIGEYSGGGGYWNGSIANVQVYNTSLAQAQISQLYHEGISGIPLNNGGLVGWWPLNGNANDYSNNGNNGTTNYISFVRTSITPLWGYNASYNESLLHAFAELYINGQSAVANLLLNNLYNSSNAALFINNEYAPAMNLSQFNGASSISTPLPTSAATGTTISAWFSTPTEANGQVIVLLGNNGGTNGYGIYLGGTNTGCPAGQFAILESGVRWVCTLYPFSTNKWYNAVLVSTASGNNVVYTLYVNGNDAYTSPPEPLPNTPVGSFLMGNDLAGHTYNGTLADVQVYNTAFLAAQAMQLYLRGVAGTPISNAGLVGWWPLDGNANDYSGRGNAGAVTNVVYTQQGPGPIGLQNAYSVSKASAPMLLNVGGTSKLYNVSVVVWH